MADIDVIEDASPTQGSSSDSRFTESVHRTPDPIKICGVGQLTL